jgi:uncharacterized protein YutE (UPF0331/DUF86 family)
MVDRDVVIAKIAAIEQGLARIADVRARRDAMESADYEDVVEVNLQRVTQDAIDLAAHVVASERWGVVDHVARHFTTLEQHGVIDADLALRMRSMVGFRNLAVHQYAEIDPNVVEAIVRDHLGDVRAFCRAVVGHFRVGS